MEYKASEIFQFILNLELKYNLLEYKINDIFFWKLIRFNIFSYITKNAGLSREDSPKNIKVITPEKMKKLFNREVSRLRYNAFKGNYSKDILFFLSPRKTKVDGKYMDIYMHFFIAEIAKTNEYELLDLAFINNEYHNQNKTKLAIYSYIQLIIMSFFKEIKMSLNDRDLLGKIQTEIYQCFNINIDVVEIVQKSIQSFKLSFNYYDKLIKKRKPREIYIICSYGLEALIAAARENNVGVVEIQHGVITKYHVGYSFPNNSIVPYFPDRIILYGKYWSDSTPFPLPESSIIIYGYPYLEMQIKKYKNIKKQKNNIIFLSQPNITTKLSEIAYEFAQKNNEYNIIFKLHPKEYNNWRENHETLLKAINLANFDIIDNNKNLYEVLAECNFQVGVNSTSIFEGIAMGLKTILVNLSGIEYMEYLFEKNLAFKVENADELLSFIKQDFALNYEKGYFFKDIIGME